MSARCGNNADMTRSSDTPLTTRDLQGLVRDYTTTYQTMDPARRPQSLRMVGGRWRLQPGPIRLVSGVFTFELGWDAGHRDPHYFHVRRISVASPDGTSNDIWSGEYLWRWAWKGTALLAGKHPVWAECRAAVAVLRSSLQRQADELQQTRSESFDALCHQLDWMGDDAGNQTPEL